MLRFTNASTSRRSRCQPSGIQLKDLVGKQPYLTLQPIVVNIRNCDPAGSNMGGLRLKTGDGETAAFKIFLSQQHVLWVVDGQHRRKAMEIAFAFLDTVRAHQKYPKKGGLFAASDDAVSPMPVSPVE